MKRYSCFVRFSCATIALAMAAGSVRDGAAQDSQPAAELPARLDEVQRRLAARDVGEETQAAQTAVLDSLERWIAVQQRQEAAEQSASGGASGTGRKKASAASTLDAPASSNDAPESPGPGLPQGTGPSGQDGWGRISAPQREAWLQSLGQRGFPTRYRRQLDAYFRRLPPRDVPPP